MKIFGYINTNENGFTLLEMVLSLVIMVFIGAVTFQLFYISSNNWLQAKTRTESAHDANRAMKLLGDDIRSSQKSSISNRAVLIDPSGNIMDIFRYNVVSSMYEQIRYRYESSDHTLKRAMVASSTPINITNWNSISFSTIANNVSATASSVFQDTSPADTAEGGRRRIAVNLQVDNAPDQGLNSAYTVNDVYSTRSQVVEGQAIGVITTVPVTGITVNPASMTNIANTGTTFTATATIYPNHATNKTISAASSVNWMRCTVSGLIITVTVDPYTALFAPITRSGSITVTSVDGNWSRLINCSQKRY